MYDLLIVGGGPTGLHAALKAAVLNHTVLLVDKGRAFSRVSQAPAIANLPFAAGISGAELLEAGRRDLERFARLKGRSLVDVAEDTEAVWAKRDAEGFVLSLRDARGTREVRGRVLVLATGIVDRKPGIEGFHARGHGVLAPFVSRGAVGYCVLCEGWRVEGKRLALIGASADAVQVAHDLATHFGADVTVLTDDCALEADCTLSCETEGLAKLREEEGRVVITLRDGRELSFDQAFFHLGWYKANNELAVQLGAAVDREGFVMTDANCEALDRDGRVIRGLFAVGDLRAGSWKQIVVGWGDAETAVISAYAWRLPDEPARAPMRAAGRAGAMAKESIAEGGSSSLAQRDASAEITEEDLTTGERNRGKGTDAKAAADDTDEAA